MAQVRNHGNAPVRITRRPRLGPGRLTAATRLQEERIGRKLSQEAVARGLERRGISVTGRYIGLIEAGKAAGSEAVLTALAGFFGVSRKTLRGWLEPIDPTQQQAAA